MLSMMSVKKKSVCKANHKKHKLNNKNPTLSKKNPPSKEIKNQSNSTHTCKTPKAKQCHQKKKKKKVWVYEESGLLSDGQTAGLCDTSNTEREL